MVGELFLVFGDGEGYAAKVVMKIIFFSKGGRGVIMTDLQEICLTIFKMKIILVINHPHKLE